VAFKTLPYYNYYIVSAVFTQGDAVPLRSKVVKNWNKKLA